MRIFAALVFFVATLAMAETKCPPDPNWSYKGPLGPSHWVDHWPSCGHGKAQSPVDIPADIRRQSGPAIEFHYQPFNLVVENTSHVIEVPVPDGSYIMRDGHRYELRQFHFHTPSEHHMGGKAYGLEVHLVHEDVAGKRAVVAILAGKNAANPALQPITAALPVASCGHGDQHVRFDASTLLPETGDYITYGGSLTTPGCDEGVTWLVLTHLISASDAQRARLGRFGVNARPVQLRNGRAIVHVGR